MSDVSALLRRLPLLGLTLCVALAGAAYALPRPAEAEIEGDVEEAAVAVTAGRYAAPRPARRAMPVAMSPSERDPRSAPPACVEARPTVRPSLRTLEVRTQV